MIKNTFQMNECTLASHDLCFGQLSAICCSNPQHELGNTTRRQMWAEMMEASGLPIHRSPTLTRYLPTEEMPDGILPRPIIQHRPQTGSWDLKAREKLHNAQKFALAQGEDTVAPLRVCSAISASHDFSV